MSYSCKLFVLKIVIWSNNCLQKIIIFSSLKLYNRVPRNDSYQIEIITWYQMIICIR